eukprot:TRINITY_DN23947_c0_g1_i1.p1 TRINITY_DN23947_c0_g1~~TRINITY_DN23947_c0_g1_i1.p1  ORF type:complete len:400 (+),score=-70.63 TRINITY_DN23947_c0_g1_i1:178-1377(+)
MLTVIEPKYRGFICTAAHPEGCYKNVEKQVAWVTAQPRFKAPKRVLVLGGSTGYGLASRIVPAFGGGASTLGVCFEKAASGKRTASPGWYNTAAFEKLAGAQGLYAKTLNGDAFSEELKAETARCIEQDWGQVDCVIYSLASPRRQDPRTGEVYTSVLKPTQAHYSSKTVDPMRGEVSTIELEVATQEEIAATVKVMGGEDWALWIEYLAQRGLLAEGCKTVAYSYLGPKLTYPIYRQGTIGHAKEHLHNTARALNKVLLDKVGGHAYISVNKALVTQASSAIPVVPLYIALLFKLMKAQGTHEGCIQQIYRLYQAQLYGDSSPQLDSSGLIRLDDWELAPEIQEEVEHLWAIVDSENLATLADVAGYQEDFAQLFGFSVPGVDYTLPVETEVAVPSLV